MTQPELVQLEPLILAVTEASTTVSEIPTRINAMFDTVYRWQARSGVGKAGNNYALYDHFTDEGMRLRVGFPVAQRFAGEEDIRCAQLAGGTAAHVTHRGPYSDLPNVHAELNRWCATRSLQVAGESWEVYCDWQDDPARLVTDVYIRLLRS